MGSCTQLVEMTVAFLFVSLYRVTMEQYVMVLVVFSAAAHDMPAEALYTKV